MGSRGRREGKRRAFTLVEIMVVVALIALLATLALPGILRARKRSQATQVKNDLRLLDGAVEQYAIETGKAAGAAVEVSDWASYIRSDTRLARTGEDILGNDFGAQTVDEIPFVPVETYLELGDVAADEFWEPFDL